MNLFLLALMSGCVVSAPSLTWRGDDPDDQLGLELAVRPGSADETTLLALVECGGSLHEAHDCSGARVVGLGARSPAGRVGPAARFATGDGEGAAWVGDPDGDGDPDFAVALAGGIHLFDLAATEARGVRPDDAWAVYDEPFGLRPAPGGDIDGDGADDLCWGSFDAEPEIVGVLPGPVLQLDGDPIGPRGLGDSLTGDVWEVRWAPGGVFVATDHALRFAPLDEDHRPRLDLADEWVGCGVNGVLSIADVDEDGRDDAFFREVLLRGASPGRCDEVAINRWTGDDGEVAAASAFGDFDGDGVVDLAVAGRERYRRRIGVFLGPVQDRSLSMVDADRILGNPGPAEGGFGDQVEAADIDGDGLADLVTTAPNRRGGRVYVWFGSDLFP